MAMNREWLGTLVLGALALVGDASRAAEPRIGKFVAYDAGEFRIVTSRSGDQARQVIEDLAKFRVTLEKLLNKRATNTAIRTQILIVSGSDWHRYLEPRQNLAGWFQRADFANYVTINGDADRAMAVATLFHEYTHYYLASQFSGEYPPWFNEGIAEFMGYTMFDAKGRAIMRLPVFNIYEARDSDWIPFERLIKVDHWSPEYQSHKLNGSFYAQAWLTVHYGMLGNRDFSKKMFAYLAQLNSLQPIDEAARNTFGDLAAVDRELRAYSRAKMMSGVITLGDLPAVTLPQPTPVSETDALAIFINLMLEIRTGADRIRPLVDSLLRKEPNASRPHILAARLALATDDNAAFERETAAAEAALVPKDWEQRRELAAALLESASNYRGLALNTSAAEKRNLQRAYQLYADALLENNEDIELLWGFGTAAAQLGQNMDLAEQALVAAYKHSPGNADIAMSLADVKRAQEDYDAMLVYLEDTERFANNLGQRKWATDTLVEMRRYVVERKRVDEENRKIDEANRKQQEEYLKAVAEYEKKYGKRKKKTGG